VTSSIACARVRVLLEAYIDGDLAPDVSEGVRVHLSTCEDCRRQYEQAVSLPFRMRALRSPAPPEDLIPSVLRSVAPVHEAPRAAWILVLPEAVLVGFILWYMSGLDGLASLVTGGWSDLQSLFGWGAGSASLPDIPVADALLLVALLALSITAAYHLSVLVRLGDENARPALRERRGA
jgi:predicted anti-sigma-YlaC factor YlaD